MAGRGGAGNIEAANHKISHDLEASQNFAETGQDPSPIELALASERKDPKIKHSGRGGAGNTFDPVGLMRTGRYMDDNDAVKMQAASVYGDGRMRGRGGAGNFAANPDVIQGTDTDLVSARKRERERIEQDVEKGLPRPGAAYLGPREQQKEAPLDKT